MTTPAPPELEIAIRTHNMIREGILLICGFVVSANIWLIIIMIEMLK